MGQQIIPLKLKYTNCYLIKGSEGFIMVGAGAFKIYPSHGKPFNAKVFDEYYNPRE